MIIDKITGLNNNIAILGDSWSFGEWYPLDGHDGSYIDIVPVVSHPSPQVYLHQHFNNLKIYHIGQVGGQNNNSANALKQHKHLFDFAIVYWTCPSREILNKWENSDSDLSSLTIEGYKNRVLKCSKSALEDFNDCDMPILFVGGHVSLPDLSEYKNCIPVVERMTNLIDNPYYCPREKTSKPGSVHNKIDWEGIGRFEQLGHGNYNLSEQFLNDINELKNEEMYHIKNNYQFNPYYFPDQGHGGRHLHKLATDKIIEYIKTNNLINTVVN